MDGRRRIGGVHFNEQTHRSHRQPSQQCDACRKKLCRQRNVNAPALATPSPLATSVAATDDDDDEKYCEARFSNDVSAEYCCDPIIDGRARNDGSADDE